MYLSRISTTTLLLLSISILFTTIPPSSALFGEIAKALLDWKDFDLIKNFWSFFYDLEVVADPKVATPLPNPSQTQTPTLDDAKYYIHYAAAAGCNEDVLTDWSCIQCKTIIGSSSSSPIVGVQVLTNDSWGTQGYIATDTAKAEIILAFRGSKNPTNFWEDFAKVEMIDPGYGDEGVKIHQGFHNSAKSLYPDVHSSLSKLIGEFPSYRVVITGHSLGAAMATSTYYFLSHDLPNVQYAIYSYGEPRSGNLAYATYINSKSIELVRVVNEADVIPHVMPASLGFVHHEREFWTVNGTTRICAEDVYEDLSCSDSIPSDDFNTGDHLIYLNVSIIASCTEEKSLWEKLTGK